MIVGRSTKRYFKYVAVSALTILFSLNMVFGCLELQQIKVIIMYLCVMLGHWLVVRRSINRSNPPSGG